MAIITISRQEGSLSREIASAIAEKFKLDYIDKTAIENVLERDFDIEPGEIKKYDEKKPSLWDSFTHDYDRYFDFFKLYFFEKAVESNGCILLGRGGAFFLKRVPGVFKIRLIASEDVRIKRVCGMYKCDEKSADKIIHQTDHDRSRFHKFLFNDSWDNPLYYDMVLNTSSLTTETSSKIISDSIETFISENYDAENKKVLKELYTAQRIKNRILYTENIPVHHLEIRVKDGHVAMSGTLDDKAAEKDCIIAAEMEPGVKSAVSNFLYLSRYNTAT